MIWVVCHSFYYVSLLTNYSHILGKMNARVVENLGHCWVHQENSSSIFKRFLNGDKIDIKYHFNHFKIYCSVVLSTSTSLCNQLISPVLHLAKLETLCPLNANSPFPPSGNHRLLSIPVKFTPRR